jgi:hypothetical protein
MHDASAASLTAMAPALRAAWRAARVEPLILAAGELRSLTFVFPTKFLDIRDYHVVLVGENPFLGLDAPRELVRVRIEQALRNMLLRLRRRYVAIADDPAGMTIALQRICRPLALELEALLRLKGAPVPHEDRTAAIFEAAATSLGYDRNALARLAQLRAGREAGEDLSLLYDQVLRVIARAADTVAEMKEASP